MRIALMLIINNAMHANKKNLQDKEFYLRPGKSKIQNLYSQTIFFNNKFR